MLPSVDKATSVRVRYVCCTQEVSKVEALRFDADGYLVCPVHSERRYGWLSSPMKAHKITTRKDDNAHAEQEIILRPDWGCRPIDADANYVLALKSQIAILDV